MHLFTISLKKPAAALLFLFMWFALPIAVAAAETAPEQQLLAAFKGGSHIALMRHALAPGIGDPDNFSLDDCATQRNLSAAGRKQAETIGRKFRQAGIEQAQVYTSQWCRCRETAALLKLGTPQDLVMLNSFFRDYGRREMQTDSLRQWLIKQSLSDPVVLVTHQVNITAFSGVYPGSGEIVIIKKNLDGTFTVAGTVKTD